MEDGQAVNYLSLNPFSEGKGLLVKLSQAPFPLGRSAVESTAGVGLALSFESTEHCDMDYVCLQAIMMVSRTLSSLCST